jgi:hypothetical protein
LLETTDCDPTLLATAWSKWQALLGFRNSHYQRDVLLVSAMAWGHLWATYREVHSGLYGNIDENERFNNKWIANGIAEALSDPDWKMFSAIEEYHEQQEEWGPDRRPWRDDMEALGFDADDLLHRRPNINRELAKLSKQL